MKNVTLAIEESVVREARRIAVERSTTLNAMIREFLEELTRHESRASRARRKISALCQDSTAEVGPLQDSRDSLHER